MDLFSLFKRRKSGLLVGPAVGELMLAAPYVRYHVWVRDASGRLVGEDEVHNTVTREGLGYLLGCAFAVTSPASKKTNFFLTQIKSNTAQTTTMTASSPAGTEITYGSGDVSQANRPTLTLGAISTGADLTTCDNSASLATFNHLTTITVYGLQLFSVNAGGASSGYTGDILYGGTLYTTAYAVQNGYTVNVQGSIQVTAG